MDILMPKLDGYAACHILKSDNVPREIPMIMLSALNSELSKNTVERIGADGYVTKPFTREKLLNTISQFLPTSWV